VTALAPRCLPTPKRRPPHPSLCHRLRSRRPSRRPAARNLRTSQKAWRSNLGRFLSGPSTEASMKLACWREFGPRRLTCTTARCRHWRNCSYRLRSVCHNSKLARDTTSKMLVLTSHKRGQIVRSPIAMTSIQETADAGMTMARACATTKRRHSSNIWRLF